MKIKESNYYLDSKNKIKIFVINKIKRGLWNVKHVHSHGRLHEMTTGYILKNYKRIVDKNI